MEPLTHLFAASLLCYADDEGYFNANPGLVRAGTVPLRNADVPAMLAELVKMGFVRLGVAEDGKRYGHVIRFKEHQRISHPKESKISKLEIKWEGSAQLPENFLNVPGKKQQEGKGTGNREQGREAQSAPPDPDSGSELALANWLLEECGAVADNGTRRVAAEAIRLLAKEGGTVKTAADFILHAARDALKQGAVINRFWFSDQKYRPQVGKRPSEGIGLDKANADKPTRAQYEAWLRQPEEYRKTHRWIHEIPEAE